jgi:hypothetical protein
MPPPGEFDQRAQARKRKQKSIDHYTDCNLIDGFELSDIAMTT